MTNIHIVDLCSRGGRTRTRIMFVQSFPLILLLIGQFGYTDASDIHDLRKRSATTKNCSKTVTTETVTMVTISYTCYKRKSTTTGKWFWKKKRYYLSAQACYRQTYEKRMQKVPVAACCEGLIERDGQCIDVQSDCQEGLFGANCSQSCNCGINTLPSCDKTTGKCFCEVGYTGENCTDAITQCNDPGLTAPACNESCVDGFYGFDCQMQCACSDGESCDPVTGLCHNSNGGFTISSRTSLDTQYLEGAGGSSVAVVVSILLVAIGLVCAVIAVLLFHRNRKRKRSGMPIDNLSYGLMRQGDNSAQSDTLGRDYVNLNPAAPYAVPGSTDARTGTLTNEYQEVECKSCSPPTINKAVNNDYSVVAFKSDNLYFAMNESKAQMTYTCGEDSACPTGSTDDNVYILPSANDEIIYDVPKPANKIYSIVRHVPRETDERN